MRIRILTGLLIMATLAIGVIDVFQGGRRLDSLRRTCAALVGWQPYQPTEPSSDSDVRPQGPLEYEPRQVVEAKVPITNFDVRSGREAFDTLKPDELVIGVTVGGESRAYPLNMLSGPSREILNDTVGDTPIAATW